jgi:Protein of unknown function (DUF2914)
MRVITYLFVILFFSIAFSQQSAGPVIDEIAVCTAVENREAVAAGTSFGADVGTLYCFTKISEAAGDSSISHVWYHNDEEMARVKLNVRADVWRTWSSKRIADDWTGSWRVDVESSAGKVLASKKFVIEAALKQ